MDKTALQQVLSRLDPVRDPDPALEQYATPPDIAADLLHRVGLAGELDGSVADLGCGNGILAIGAALCGADAVGVDVDEDAVATARDNYAAVEADRAVAGTAQFRTVDVQDLAMDADLVVMNPPFGIQREDANLRFLEAAFRTAPVIYALLHRSGPSEARTRSFLDRFAAEHGFDATVVTGYDFPLPRSQSFHEQAKKVIKVDLYRFEQV